MELAVEHLNSGNGTIIAELEGLNETCPIRFTLEHVDTQGTENVAVDQLIPILQRPEGPTTTALAAEQEMQRQPPPCAFIGPFFSEEAVATSLYTSLKGYPQFAPLVTAIELDNQDTFPLFGRFVPPSASFASPLLEFLVGTLGVEHLAVLYTDQATDLTYVSGIRETIKNEYPQVQMQSFSFNVAGRRGAEDDYAAVVEAVKRTGYRYIFNLVEVNFFQDVMLEAYRQGIVGPSYTWIAASLGSINKYWFNQEFLPNSEMALIGGGLLSFDVTRRQGKFDTFKAACEDLVNHQDDLDFLQSKLPPSVVPYGRGSPLFTNGTFDRFFDAIAAYYDTTISLGLAACYNQTTTTTTGTGELPYLTGPSHYKHMINRDNVTVVGASGPLILDPRTGSRDPRSIFYQISNVVPQRLPNGNITFQDIKTHLFLGGWSETTPIVFSDNTTSIPEDLPPQEIDNNHVGVGLRAAGLTMSWIVMLTALGLAVWTLEHRSSRIVLASQPIFLFIILFGTFLMGASIIPKSLDDEVVGDDGADIACAAFPWLLALGWCFAFSALFSKTYRVNKIFHNPNFKRVKIEAKDVMIPMLSLLGCNVLILSIWSALSPLTWERYVVGYDAFGRPNATKGHCVSDNWLPYVLSLGIVNLGILVVAMYQAWIARKISLEFAESEWIARVMNAILLVSFVGVPVLVIADEDPSAFYFVLCAVIFVICVSLLVFIFGPKCFQMHFAEKTAPKTAIQQTLNKIKKPSEGYPNSDLGINPLDPAGSDVEINSARSAGCSCGLESSNDFRASNFAPGARVLNHPALAAAKEAEMRQLKKEKKILREKLLVMQQTSFRRNKIDGGEIEGLLELKEKVTAKDDLMGYLRYLEENMQGVEQDKQQETERREELEVLLEQKKEQEVEVMQKMKQLKDTNEELRQILQNKNQEIKKLTDPLKDVEGMANV